MSVKRSPRISCPICGNKMWVLRKDRVECSECENWWESVEEVICYIKQLKIECKKRYGG